MTDTMLLGVLVGMVGGYIVGNAVAAVLLLKYGDSIRRWMDRKFG